MVSRLILLYQLLAFAGSLSGAVDFVRDVRPILETTCVACHGARKAGGGVRLDQREWALKVVTPGKPEQSRLYQSTQIAPGRVGIMPPGGTPLTAEQAGTFRAWILEGAAWPNGVTLGMPAGAMPDDIELTGLLYKKIAPSVKAAFQTYEVTIPGSDVAFEMVPIQGGDFEMGSGAAERSAKPDERPRRKVTIEPFWMGKAEVTWNEYRLFMNSTAKDEWVDAVSRPTRPYVEMSFGMGIDGFPAISMTQHAANKYCQWLSAKTGHFYRLPTEAEWEYACRAGTATAYSFGDDASMLDQYAWHDGNSDGKYQKVGMKKPNPWGLFDMHGNVMEWTLDQYTPYDSAAVHVPWVRATKPYPHAVRGGSWMDGADRLRSAARTASDSSWKMQDPQLPRSIWYHTDAQGLGLRVVRPRKIPSVKEMHHYWNSGVEHE